MTCWAWQLRQDLCHSSTTSRQQTPLRHAPVTLGREWAICLVLFLQLVQQFLLGE